MKITSHARKRMQQRGINETILDLLLTQGIPVPGPGNVLLYELPRWFIQLVEKAMRCRAVCEDGTVITVEKIRQGPHRRKKDRNKPYSQSIH